MVAEIQRWPEVSHPTSSIHGKHDEHPESKLDLYVATHYSSLHQHQVLPIVSSSFILSMFALAALVVFRPLLVGLVKAAALLLLRPCSREEQRARAHLRDVRLIQRIIAADCDPETAAELRALAARG